MTMQQASSTPPCQRAAGVAFAMLKLLTFQEK